MHDLKERTSSNKLRPINGVAVRKPTGVPPWPLVLIEGNEKSGKTWSAAVFSGSKKLGQTYWIDISEGSADEYGAVPGANYLIVEHDGTWNGILSAVQAIHQEAQRASEAGEPPVCLVIDSMTAIYDLLKSWGHARSVAMHSNQRTLQKDPNAEIKISNDKWNDINARHQRLTKLLTTFPGPVLATARGKKVSVYENGQPTKEKTHSVQAQSDFTFEANIWIRMERGSVPHLVAVRGANDKIKMDVHTHPSRPLPDFDLEALIFDFYGCDPETTKSRAITYADGSSELDPNTYRDKALVAVDKEELREVWVQASEQGLTGAVVTNENGDDEDLGELIKRKVTELKAEEA